MHNALLTRDSSIGEDVIIRLKWGQTEYKGRLISVDSYMNIQLSDTEEYIDRKHTGTLGQVLIRYDMSSVTRAWTNGRLIVCADAIMSCGYQERKASI